MFLQSPVNLMTGCVAEIKDLVKRTLGVNERIGHTQDSWIFENWLSLRYRQNGKYRPKILDAINLPLLGVCATFCQIIDVSFIDTTIPLCVYQSLRLVQIEVAKLMSVCFCDHVFDFFWWCHIVIFFSTYLCDCRRTSRPRNAALLTLKGKKESLRPKRDYKISYGWLTGYFRK